MKKVGIMSMQRIRNYGSFMQAYGLYNILKNNQCEVEFVDYKEEKPIIEIQEKFLNKICFYKNPINLLKEKIYNKLFNYKYDNMIKKYLNVQNKKNLHPNIDMLVIGSDEVFNCFQGSPVGYSRELFGKDYQMPVISYAASFGNTSYKKIKEYKIDSELSQLLNNFKSISVRDKNSYEIIKKLTNNEAVINVDPVLTMDVKNIKRNSKIFDKEYLLIYAYARRLTKEEEKYIKKYAKNNKLEIISIGGFQTIANKNLIVNPFEIFDYFEKAKLVITDTFHGTIFSIKTHANFVSIIRNSNKNKLYDLLDRLYLKERIIENIMEIDKKAEEKIDYMNTDKIIRTETKNTMNYINAHIRG